MENCCKYGHLVPPSAKVCPTCGEPMLTQPERTKLDEDIIVEAVIGRLDRDNEE
jgi:hypothetical protein